MNLFSRKFVFAVMITRFGNLLNSQKGIRIIDRNARTFIRIHSPLVILDGYYSQSLYFSPSFSLIETFKRAQTQTSVYNRSRDYLLRILLYPSYFKLSPNISTNNPESRDPFTLLRTRITSVRNKRSCCANLQLYYFFFFFKNNNAMRISCTRREFIFQLHPPRLGS